MVVKIKLGMDNIMNERIYDIREDEELVEKIKDIVGLDDCDDVDIYFNDDVDSIEDNNVRISVETEAKRYDFSADLIYSEEGNVVDIEQKSKVQEDESSLRKIKHDKLDFDIEYWSYNITYDQLSKLYENGRLIIPKMQRNFVWDKVQASRLIESIFMGLPLPSLFLVGSSNKKYVVVDGLQRITTIACFKNNKALPIDNNKENGFKLRGVNPKFEGLSYEDIKNQDPDLFMKFDMGTINVIEFKQESPQNEDVMYTLFERLNSGGTNLSSQQIRNSIYYGFFNDKLNEFAEERLKKYFSNKQKLNLVPSEVALRAIGIFKKINNNDLDTTIVYKKLYNEIAQDYHLKFKKANLNNDRVEKQNLKNEVDMLFNSLEKAISKIEDIFGENAFKRYDEEQQKFTARIAPVIFEAMTVTIMLNKDGIFKSNEDIMSSYKEKIPTIFEKYCSQSTGKKSNIVNRIKSINSIFFE